MSKQAYAETQRRYYENADASHFEWQTIGPCFAETEAALVKSMRVQPGDRLLEIGCGEGGNLFHLRDRQGTLFGVDFSAAKVAFAHDVAGVHSAAADAALLPFADGSFDAILIRDLLHHLPFPSLAIAEARRVLRPGGRLTLIEPNVKSILVLLQAAVIEAERGLFRSTAKRLRKLLEAGGFVVEREETLQPFPIARVLLHPKMGSPKLGKSKILTGALSILDRMAEHLLPRSAWMYLIFEASPSTSSHQHMEILASALPTDGLSG